MSSPGMSLFIVSGKFKPQVQSLLCDVHMRTMAPKPRLNSETATASMNER